MRSEPQKESKMTFSTVVFLVVLFSLIVIAILIGLSVSKDSKKRIVASKMPDEFASDIFTENLSNIFSGSIVLRGILIFIAIYVLSFVLKMIDVGNIKFWGTAAFFKSLGIVVFVVLSVNLTSSFIEYLKEANKKYPLPAATPSSTSPTSTSSSNPWGLFQYLVIGFLIVITIGIYFVFPINIGNTRTLVSQLHQQLVGANQTVNGINTKLVTAYQTADGINTKLVTAYQTADGINTKLATAYQTTEPLINNLTTANSVAKDLKNNLNQSSKTWIEIKSYFGTMKTEILTAIQQQPSPAPTPSK
jgi:hypothetical protein